jgi:SAM-dependent methyltransferase
MLLKIVKTIVKFFRLSGIDFIKIINTMRGLPSFIIDFIKLKKENDKDLFPIELYPILDDKYKQGGTANGHYFHQDLVVAKKIYDANPKKHIDIGSRVDGFVAHLAVFREVVIIDIRDLTSQTKNIEFQQANMIDMKDELYNSCSSISSLHALEHFGLGRYGDPIDADGHVKGFNNMYNILQEGGVFYFSVPIGRQRIEFNAHRVFSIKYLLEIFDNKFDIIDFSFVDDKGDLNEHITLNDELIETNCACHYGCGIFELRKKSKYD